MKIKYIIRTLWKNKLFTSLNILGLAIGISACWIVFKIVNYEFSFDKQHPDREQIYKIYGKFKEDNEINRFDGVTAPLWAYIKENNPQIDLTVPIFNQYFEKVILDKSKNDEAIDDPKDVYSTTTDYFKLVPYEWVAGDPKTALNSINNVVLTVSRAKKYFPNEKPQSLIGKTLQYDTTMYAVSGIIQDLPYPSSFSGKEFLAVKDQQWKDQPWVSFNSNNHLYVKIKDPNQVEPFVRSIDKKLAEMTDSKWAEYNIKGGFELGILKELHFNPIINGSADKKIIYGMVGIGIFLLLLASINYINLSTALIPQRAKEIGIRKTLGQASRSVTQSFITETFLITFVALLLSWPINLLFEHFFSHYYPANIGDFSFSYSTITFLFILLVLITLFSSLYPTYLINKVQIIDVLKSNKSSKLSFGNISIRKALIVFQFIIAQVFVIATCIVGFQLQYLMNTDLGFQKDAILTSGLPYKDPDSQKSPFTFKEILEKHPEIQAASLGHFPLSDDHWGNYVTRSTDTGTVKTTMPFKLIDDQYLDVYDIKLLAGRALTLADTNTGIVLNEKAIADLGFKSPESAIGQQVEAWDKNRQVTGVVKNFHTKNLHSQMEGLAFLASNKRGQLQKIAIKLPADPATWQKTMEILQTEWEAYYTEPYAFDFYDQRIKNMYESDYRFSKIINLSSTITILISCLGLIGLVTITTAQRTKEIGIRKVLGSSISGIISLLSKDYLKLVFVSILIATPIAWWAMNKWLTDFAYKVDLQWWMFGIPAILTLLIACLTMSLQSIKAARANPVDSLRDE